MEIKNREGIVRELADMLHQFDKELNDYITDVYAYYDEEEKTVTLDTFINVGGNSWLNDDHITIYRDDNHIDEPIDVFDTIEDIAEVVGIKKNDLIKKIATEEELDEDEVDYYKVARYATENYEEKIQAAYEDKLDLDSGINLPMTSLKQHGNSIAINMTMLQQWIFIKNALMYHYMMFQAKKK